MRKYRLELTEAQLRVVNAALEEFFRLPLNQWDRLAERLAFKGVDLQDEKTRERNFDRCIAAKDAAQEVFKAAGRILWQHGTPQKDDEQMIAEDIWQVIRHQLYLDSGSTDTWRVDAREPLLLGPEPPAMIECIGGISYDKKEVCEVANGIGST